MNQAEIDIGKTFLEHYGVKGMKWGERRSRRQLERARKQTEEHRVASELRKKKSSQLTNRELQVVNERLNLEQNYRRLNPTTVQRGHNSVKAILAVGGTGVAAYKMVNSAAGQAAIASARKALGK